MDIEILRKLRREQELEVSRCHLAESEASENHIKAADKLAAIDYLIKQATEEFNRKEDERMQEMVNDLSKP